MSTLNVALLTVTRCRRLVTVRYYLRPSRFIDRMRAPGGQHLPPVVFTSPDQASLLDYV
jgi:hypothetical protein